MDFGPSLDDSLVRVEVEWFGGRWSSCQVTGDQVADGQVVGDQLREVGEVGSVFAKPDSSTIALELKVGSGD